jgi:hypothetical protein
MPRKSFFDEIRQRHISAECKERRHEDCDGRYYPSEWLEHDKPCSCHCHLTMAQRMRLKVMKEIDKRRR